MTDIELYNQAKEAYYNGTPIMTDYEFDELEERLGLSNKSYVGAKHNPSYTVKHPMIMGSLSKVQIKKSDDGVIDWVKYYSEVSKYIHRYANNAIILMTPKFDGCSFEVTASKRPDGTIYINSISTRGDGEWGRDIRKHIEHKFDGFDCSEFNGEFVLRGEVLIDKQVFANKYSEFVNPRSFVSGVLNRDYDENDTEIVEMCNDLSIVIYDVREYDNVTNTWTESDWKNFNFQYQPSYYFQQYIYSDIDLKKYYEIFEAYREKCPFALDGIVLKPLDLYRKNNNTDARPDDCVAIKFVPMLEETEVVSIEWSTRKTNELRPVIKVRPVIMDGKQVAKASAHNYGYLIDNKISVGTKVILSLAGDIIPFIYKITDTTAFDENNMCLPNCETYQEGCHLYKELTIEEANRLKFISSAAALNIPSIGPAAAETIYDYMVEQCKGDEFFGTSATETPNNILLIMPADIDRALGGKLGSNAKKAFVEYIKTIRISDIIVSCTFESCGTKVAEQIENQMLFENGDFEHLASKAYQWVFNGNDDVNYKQVMKIINFLGINFDDYKIVISESQKETANQIPVILTGEPNNYKSKGEFLKEHPEYRMTSSWKEVQIVFTNDLNSKTGKMKKAIEKGIEIKLY